MRTKRQRRLLVVVYYAILVGVFIFGLRIGNTSWAPLTAQTLVFGGLLGGIRIGGPVKVYEEANLPLGNGGVQTLNIEGRPAFHEPAYGSPLDEREQTERDRAHYMAYRILRWAFGMFVLTYFAGSVWFPVWLADKTLFFLWLFLLYVLSLPQSVVLWTEPDEAAGELVVAGARGR